MPSPRSAVNEMMFHYTRLVFAKAIGKA